MMKVHALCWRLPCVLLVGLMLWPQTGLADNSRTRWVVTAEASKSVKSIGDTLRVVLKASPAGIALDGDVVRFKFTGNEDAPFEVLLTKNEMSEHDGTRVRTRHGVLHLPGPWEFLDATELAARVDGVEPIVPWRKASLGRRPLTRTAQASVDESERRRLLSLRRRNLLLRRGENTPKVYEHHESPISEALAQGLLPTSDLCENCDRDLQSSDPRTQLRASRSQLRNHPTEVRLWSLAADAAFRLARFSEASAYADVATSMARPDALAFQTWSRLTGESNHIPEDALPFKKISSEVPPWPLILFVFASLALLLGAVARYPKSKWALLGSLCLAAVAIGAFATTPAESTGPERLDVPTSLPDSLIAPLAGTACKASPPFRSVEGLEIFARCGDKPFSFEIRPLTGEALTVTKHHALSVHGANQSQITDQALRLLKTAVRSAEESGFRATPREPTLGVRNAYVPGEDSFEMLEWRMSRSLVILGFVLGLLVALHCFQVLWKLRRTDSLLFTGITVLGVVTVLLHVIVPDRLVMVYTGYDLTERLAMLEATPRYGAGGMWLYEPFFAVFGEDHASIQLANRVFGVLSFFPLSLLVLRFAPGRTALWVISVFVFLPLLWRDHTSEGIMAGSMWLMLSALAAWVSGLVQRDQGYLLPCALWIAAAASTVRPEAGPSLCLAAAGLWFLRPEAREHCTIRWLAFFAIVFGGLTLGHGMWLLESAQTQVDQSSILGAHDAGSVLTSVLTDQNLLFDPTLFPLPWWIWVLAAFLASSAASWKARLGLVLVIVAAFSWIALSAVDLPTVSVPRVHLPALTFLVVPMSLGSHFFSGWRPGLNGAVAVIACAAGLITAPKLLASSNAQEEETLIRIAASEMRNPKSCLAILDFSDPPSPGKTQRHFPDYLFGESTVIGLSKYAEQEAFCSGDKLALLGTRCYMAMRSSSDQEAPQDGELPVCSEFRRTYRLEPVHVVSVENRRDFTFDMYPSRDELPIGVYRILERMKPGPSPANEGSDEPR